MAHPCSEVTLTLRDTPAGVVSVHSTYKPAIGQPITPAQALALDLQNQACHRAGVVKLADGGQEGAAA